MLELVCKAQVKHTSDAVRGHTLEAVEAVDAGCDIICETPLLVLDKPQPGEDGSRLWDADDFKAAFAKLDERQKRLVAELSVDKATTDHPISKELTVEEDHFRRVLQAVAHSFGSGQSEQSVLFENISFASHSCDPNAVYCATQGLGRARLLALRAVAKGEAVTISYIPKLYLRYVPLWKRRRYLLHNFGFECCCNRCKEEIHTGSSAIEASQQSQDLAFCKEELLDLLIDGASDDEFLAAVELHLRRCEEEGHRNDGMFHLFASLDMLVEFHSIRLLENEWADIYLTQVLAALGRKYRAMPLDEHLRDERSLDAVFLLTARMLQEGKLAKSRPALRRLWLRLGGLLRDNWGEASPEYKLHCDVFECVPEGRPLSAADVATELQLLRACRVRSCSAPFLPACASSGLQVCKSPNCKACSSLAMCSSCDAQSRRSMRIIVFLVLSIALVLHWFWMDPSHATSDSSGSLGHEQEKTVNELG